MKKYELTEETIKINKNKTLYRIKALRDFGDVKAGDLGGYVESEKNLSQEGDCWIYDKAKVFGSAVVYNKAEVYDSAEVFGSAEVFDSAQVYGFAQVSDSAEVFGNASVSCYAEVFGNASVSGSALVYNKAQVSGSAMVSGSAQVCGLSIVYDNAKYTAASNLDSLSILKGVYESAFAKSSQLIEYYANEFYHQIEPDFSIRIYKDTTVKSEPIVIDFICDGSKRGYSVLSEGQIDVAAMAYRVGLAKTIMAMSDNKIDVIVLDEPFADLDEYNRELIKKALIQLQTEFKKILLISHTPDITDCDNIVEVIMDKEKKSYLKIR